MYVADRQVRIKERHPVRNVLVTLLILGLIAAGFIIWLVLDLRRSQHIKQGDATPIISNNSETLEKKYQLIEEPLFTFELPTSWKLINRSSPTDSEQFLQWQQDEIPRNRWLKLYVDTIPNNLSVNKMMPVTVSENKLLPGHPSDNCNTFTNPITADGKPQQGVKEMKSKWQNVEFICDLAYPDRGATGTGTKEGGYAITLTGNTRGKHSIFMLYTERGVESDYEILSHALKTFKIK